VPLVWSDDDGYDETGARLATVARFRDVLLGAEGGVASDSYWNAFLVGEYVLVDGEIGRWRTRAEAQAVAEAAYEAYRSESPERFRYGIPEAAFYRPRRDPPRPRPGGERTGAVAHVRSLVRAWRTVRASPPRDDA
jgi:hypothetical protein